MSAFDLSAKRVLVLLSLCAAMAIALQAQTFTMLFRFDSEDGANPTGALIQSTDRNFYGTTESGGDNGVGGTVFKISPGGALSTVYNFCLQSNCPSGANPLGGVVQGTDGNFYGTTSYGGADSQGTVFKGVHDMKVRV